MSDSLSPTGIEVDPRPRRLLERYASLSGGMLLEVGDHLLELSIPPSERRFFDERDQLLIALTPLALDERSDAEILVNGSGLLRQLIEAIRDRGSLESHGIIAPTTGAEVALTLPGVQLEGTIGPSPTIDRSLVPVGRLLARLSIRAGSSIVERLVQSAVINLSTGAEASPAVAALCSAEPGPTLDDESIASGWEQVRRLPMSSVLKAMIGDLERQVAPELDAIGAEASMALTAEIARLESYYGRMDAELEPNEEAESARARRKAIQSERARRIADEKHRFGIRVDVYPVQLSEWLVPNERATWSLVDASGKVGQFSAARALVAETNWTMRCPACGGDPGRLMVCAEQHVCCGDCGAHCGVCGATACKSHGLTTCEVEGHPVCAEHSATCMSCERVHCTVHASYCDIGDHGICSECAVSCAVCSKRLCRTHASHSVPTAPLGQRWLCSECAVTCEGGTNEIVGIDEVERCSSCERHICHAHRSVCQVDGLSHCSRHLRKSDLSGRLVCEAHRGACSEEEESVYALDELAPCTTCGRSSCESHRGKCDADQQVHCKSHLVPLTDKPGLFGCEQHIERCSVDRLAFSIGGTKSCPVCGKPACARHLSECGNCGRRTCTRHFDDGWCTSCRKLAETPDPTDEMLGAVAEATGSETDGARVWRMAVDAEHTVIELPLGWRRRVVLTLRHGDTVAESVIQHGFFGQKRLR